MLQNGSARVYVAELSAARGRFLTICSRPLAVAVVALTRCRTILVERGRFRQAADREKNIAELYKNEANDPKKALESFEQAGEWYLQEGASA